jgi:putative SOS response-associated peptidase YedK
MCGRFALSLSFNELLKLYKLKNKVDLRPNYNVTPQSDIPVVLHSRKTGDNELHLLKWGLIPHWSKDASIGYKLINARADTVDSKPSFRESFKKRRCIIPAEGFYEWEKESKQPYFIKPKKGIFSFAGIWDRWADIEGHPVVTCAIITTEAPTKLANIHDRVPVVLRDDEIDGWLNPEAKVEELRRQLHATTDQDIEFWKVDRKVSKPENNYPDLITKLKD